MNLKLQTKITVIYAIVFTLVLIAINAAVILTVRFYSNYQDKAGLNNVGNTVESIIDKKDTINSNDLIENGIDYPFIVVVKSNDLDFISKKNVALFQDDKNPRIRIKDVGEITTHTAMFRNREFIAKSNTKFNITIVKDTENSRFTRNVTAKVISIASIMGMIISIIVGNTMSHETLQPIVNMRKSVENIKPTNMHERIKIPDAEDELKELGITFNKMLDKMDDAYTKQSKFVSDASHELRTPLTVIKGYVDMLHRWGKEDPEILDESISAIKEETENMSVLVENLLFIARGENQKMKVNPGKFNILELVEEISEETKMNQPLKNIEYSGDSFIVEADKKMIKQLIRIFIENALKFTSDNGTIRTTVKQDSGFAFIKVWDNGDGIYPEDLNKVFERFYIADKARTKDKSGSGLGLSIAKWIVEVHSGTVKVDSNVGEFTEFTVKIPIEYKARV